MHASVIDFYDDMGEILKSMIPDQSLIPDFVKTAEAVPRDAHPNQFAVVMVDGDQVIPRFPISDPGNAWLSSVYFHGTYESLPGEAQKTAAVMIKTAMESYGMPVTPLIDTIADGEQIESNVVDVSNQRPAAVIRPTVQDEDARDEVYYALEETADGQKLYPLKDAENAQTAEEYFDTNKHDFTFRQRREFAVKTAAAKTRAGLPIGESIAGYANPGYSDHLQAFIDVRHHYLLDMGNPEAASFLEKMASQKDHIDPETFAQTLETFDRDCGLDKAWDSHIPDPWYSTFYMRPTGFGMQKSASTDAPTEVLNAGMEQTTDADIRLLAEKCPHLVEQAFGNTVSEEFRKDPVAVFKSMPKPDRVVLARLATEAQT